MVNLCVCICFCWFFFFKQKTAYEMRISDWSSDVCSSDLHVWWTCPDACVQIKLLPLHHAYLPGALEHVRHDPQGAADDVMTTVSADVSNQLSDLLWL